ncbi:MAG: TetR/AcrR family transcriptional regulator [Candidatus Acidiferrales bacterium]
MRSVTQLATRDRLVEAAMELFYVQGYEATSVAEVLDKAEVNSGSLYYYFTGKEELLLAVLDRYKEMLWPAVMEPVFKRESDPIERIFALLGAYGEGLRYTVFTRGCPIGNLALEVGDHIPEARKKVAESFAGWCGCIEKCLEEAGERLPASLDRKKLAQFVLTVMEGAVMQARAHGSITPFDASVAQLRAYFNLLLAQGANPAQRNSASEGKP